MEELRKIQESGPVIGEDEARREFFIQEELQHTPERELAKSFAEMIITMPDDSYRQE